MADSLTLSDFLSRSGKNERILIVSSVSRGNTLIRMHEKKTGEMVLNTSCQTIDWVADQIYIYDQAEKGFDTEYELLDDQSALMIFRKTLLDNIGSLKYYNDKKNLMSIATSQELFDKVNLMRGNECVIDETRIIDNGNDRARIADLKTLVGQYEAALEAQKKHDKTSRCKYALNYLRSGAVLDKHTFGTAGIELYYLKEETDLYNSIQKELIEKVSAGEVAYFVNDLKEDEILDKLSKKKDNISFFKGLGSFNEANYIAYDILENKKHFGDVIVLYNSAAQLPAIKSALLGNNIAASVVSSYPATENCVIGFARSIVDWAKNDYSEKCLETVLGSPIIYVPGVMLEKDGKDAATEETDESVEDITEDTSDTSDLSEEEIEKLKKKNLLSGESYYNYVTKARRMVDAFTLGWGYKRNLEFIEHERNYTQRFKDDDGYYEKDSWKKCTASEIMDMHEAMLDVFTEIGNGKTLSPAILFTRLYDFVKTYTRPIFTKDGTDEKAKWKKIDNSRDIGLNLLKQLRNSLSFDSEERDADSLLSFADEALCSTSTSDSSFSDAVTVRSLNDWVPLDRKHVYIIGLSLGEMQINANQSPVINDEEMKVFLNGKNCYVPSVDSRIARKKLALDQTLATFEDGTLTFGFSYWNAEKKSPINPHYFFVKAFETIKGTAYPVKDPEDPSKDPFVYFEYGNPTADKTVVKAAVSEKTASIIDEFEKLKLSSSSLETLLSCPKSFAYSKTQNLPENEFNEKDATKWLDALKKGTFFHETMKKYSKNYLCLAVEELTEDEKKQIRDLAAEVFEEKMKNTAPIEDNKVMEREKNDLIEKEIIPYINDLREDMKNNHWKIWEPEVEFADLVLSEDTYPDSKGNIRKVTMHINSGSIDCIDYRLVEDGADKKVELRIRDYKTGSYDYKKKSFNDGDLIQYKIYAEALKTKLLDLAKEKITKAEGGKTEGWPFEFVSFRYDFPSDRDQKAKQIEIKSNELDRNSRLRLRVILTAMLENNTYPDVLELKDFVVDETNGLAVRLKTPELEGLVLNLTDKINKKTRKYKGPCIFCSYKDLCINRKSGEIKDA